MQEDALCELRGPRALLDEEELEVPLRRARAEGGAELRGVR